MAALDGCIAETGATSTAAAVCAGVGGRLRYELRFTWLGGARMLDHVRHGAALLTDRRRSARADVRDPLARRTWRTPRQ